MTVCRLSSNRGNCRETGKQYSDNGELIDIETRASIKFLHFFWILAPCKSIINRIAIALQLLYSLMNHR